MGIVCAYTVLVTSLFHVLQHILCDFGRLGSDCSSQVLAFSRPAARYNCRYHAIYEMYKKAVASFWSVEEVDLSQDTRDWKALSGMKPCFGVHK